MRIDKDHLGWGIFSVVVLVAATIAYFIFAARPEGPSGGSPLGLLFGIVGTAFIVFAALLGVRKRRPHWRVGRASTWLRGHLWLGAISFPLILFHAGFGFGGALATVLMVSFWAVFVSGAWGLMLQQILPRFMTQMIPEETVYEQIDHVRQQLLAEAIALARGQGQRRAVARPKTAGAIQGRVVKSRASVEAAEGDEARKPLILFLDERMRPFFQKGWGRKTTLRNPYRRAALFTELKAKLDPSLHAVADDLEALCEQRAQLNVQRRLHHWLHGWLLVHVPFGWLVIVLSAVHAVMALWY
ncbi:MAG: hypothetical protein ACYTGZ_17100 [Planctomycetota bacterium]